MSGVCNTPGEDLISHYRRRKGEVAALRASAPAVFGFRRRGYTLMLGWIGRIILQECPAQSAFDGGAAQRLAADGVCGRQLRHAKQNWRRGPEEPFDRSYAPEFAGPARDRAAWQRNRPRFCDLCAEAFGA